jgi:hypothetical protein
MELISISLALFHALPRRVGANVKRVALSTDSDGNFSIIWKGQTLFVPHWDYRPGSVSGAKAVPVVGSHGSSH